MWLNKLYDSADHIIISLALFKELHNNKMFENLILKCLLHTDTYTVAKNKSYQLKTQSSVKQDISVEPIFQILIQHVIWKKSILTYMQN